VQHAKLSKNSIKKCQWISIIIKRVLDDVALIPTKRLRNKIAGYTTHLMKRIQKGPVRMQEEERERRMETAPNPEEFAVKNFKMNDEDTYNMLRDLQLEHLFPRKQ
jgi:small subunit ribosomal protein S17e